MPRRRFTKPSPKNLQAPTAARRVAFEMLILSSKAAAGSMEDPLDRARRLGEINRQDASLARELAYGVLRQRRWLKHLLKQFLHYPLPKKAHKLEEVLLLGIYQWVFLDRIPAHSVVDETVRLSRVASTQKGYHSLANAVMRKVVKATPEELRPKPDSPWPLKESIPDWLASEAGQVLPNQEVPEFFRSLNQPAPLNLRPVNGAALDIESLTSILKEEVASISHALPRIEVGSVVSEAVRVHGRGILPESLPSFIKGKVTVEDEGAQLVGHLCNVEPGMRILDYCASPGGKTSHLADLCERTSSHFYATDVSEEKLDRLNETLRRLNLQDLVKSTLVDDLPVSDLQGFFDVVLVDAPCSSLGTLRRHPEARWRQDSRNVRKLAKQQLKILETVAPLVAKGGTLVYSVCTFTRMETDHLIDGFLGSDIGCEFQLSDLPGKANPAFEPLKSGKGKWRTFTHRDQCDTFFAARLTRRS